MGQEQTDKLRLLDQSLEKHNEMMGISLLSSKISLQSKKRNDTRQHEVMDAINLIRADNGLLCDRSSEHEVGMLQKLNENQSFNEMHL
ncbi:hypothetical protein NSQ77_17060 [Oceanobacillus sp. FSL K6-2867]|uniref:hypothetical protein n=1 Tax=Oceanobacillus sp. FSL K6-2867 TaxID=2954748 RepID=UPI0030DC05F1